MNITIGKDIAQKIVETVKDICGFNINYIDSNGIIFASTDRSRIEDFHEIGKSVFSSKTIVEVFEDNLYKGTKRGVNMPFFYNNRLLAVIGISGPPSEAKKYAFLALKITKIVLSELELENINYKNRREINFLIKSILDNNFSSFENDFSIFDKYNLSMDDMYSTLIIKLESKSSNISAIERAITLFLEESGSELFTFQYPNNYVLLIESSKLNLLSGSLGDLYNRYSHEINIGIGKSCMIRKQYISFNSAKTALHVARKKNTIVYYDDLDIDILLDNIPENTKKEYSEKIFKNLDIGDIDILKTYFNNSCSLKKTSEDLFIHKNTLQYSLNKIYDKSGFNPRNFEDSIILYLALILLGEK